MYRVVLTCWDYDEPTPYADDLSGVKLSMFKTKDDALESIEKCVEQELAGLNNIESDEPREKAPVLDSDGNVVGYDYPFRSDFDGEDSGIIRFWDGDDYQNVTAYNIYEVNCDSDDLDKCSYYKYRDFWILPNEAHTSFKVDQFDTTLFKCKSLEDALREVDDFVVKFQYGKPSLESRLLQAALASKEKEELLNGTKRCAVIRVFLDNIHVDNVYASFEDIDRICDEIEKEVKTTNDFKGKFKDLMGDTSFSNKQLAVTFEIEDDGPEYYDNGKNPSISKNDVDFEK